MVVTECVFTKRDTGTRNSTNEIYVLLMSAIRLDEQRNTHMSKKLMFQMWNCDMATIQQA
jgi:hypothetical protein